MTIPGEGRGRGRGRGGGGGGGYPVIEVPDESPRSPLMTVKPVLVTVVTPRAPNAAVFSKQIACALMRGRNGRSVATIDRNLILHHLTN